MIQYPKSRLSLFAADAAGNDGACPLLGSQSVPSGAGGKDCHLKNGVYYGVGVGPGDPELMTLKAARILSQCPVIAYPQGREKKSSAALAIAAAAVPAILEKELLPIPMPMVRDPALLREKRREGAERISARLKEGKDVAFLTLGDPSIYSTSLYLHPLLKSMGFEVQVVAGVPSFCAAAAALERPLADAAQPLHIVPVSCCSLEEALGWRGPKVLMKSGKSGAQVREELEKRGLLARSALARRCGMEGEGLWLSMADAPQGEEYFSLILVPEEEG